MKYQDENGEFKDIIVRASDTLPIGFIGLSPSESIPYGWLVCDGSEVSRTSYADLFKVIGETYGAGNGSTTFNLPNLKGKVPVGLDSSDNDFKNIGKTGGEKKHALTVSEMPSHSHNMFVPSGSGEDTASGTAPSSNGGDSFKTWWNTYQMEKTGDGAEHNILQPYIVQNYIIKAKQTVAVVSKTVNEYATGNDKVYDVDYINNLGVIVESGSNANGEWIKFANGTLICMGDYSITGATNIALPNGGYRTKGQTITYPQQFLHSPYTVTDSLSDTNDNGFKINNAEITKTSFAGFFWTINSNETELSHELTYIAIGKWK